MFCLSVVDHISLDFGQVAQNYTVHAEAAERFAGYVLKVRITILALLAMTVIAAVAAIVQPTWNFDVSVAIASSLALAAYVAQAAMGLETRVQAHRTCGHRLWVIAEAYRSLLTELQDGLIDPSVLLRRRDQLIERVHAAYDQAFPADQRAFESVRLNGGSGLTDESIDPAFGPAAEGDPKRVALHDRSEGDPKRVALHDGARAAKDVVAIEAGERGECFFHRRHARSHGLSHGSRDRLARQLQHVVVAGPQRLVQDR
jgi:hypothetical protein